jgi:hypothetical protein
MLDRVQPTGPEAESLAYVAYVEDAPTDAVEDAEGGEMPRESYLSSDGSCRNWGPPCKVGTEQVSCIQRNLGVVNQPGDCRGRGPP